MTLTWINCFWLIVPILLWNLLWASKLPAGYSNDTNIPMWFLWVEHLTRVGVFIYPLLLPLRPKTVHADYGWYLYVFGTLVYFAAWLAVIYFPEARWSKSPAGLLAPYYLPVLFFAGIAILGQSYIFVGVAIMFCLVHIWHGLLNFKLIS